MHTKKISDFFYQVLIPDNSEKRSSRIFNIGMLFLITLNIVAVILEIEQGLYQKYQVVFNGFEVFSVTVFTIEYILRLWVCINDKKYSNPVIGRIKYAIQPLQLIDLLAILPFYLPFIGIDLRFIRALRLFRLFRLFKIGRYSQSLKTLANVIKEKKEELSITLFSGFIILLISSILMYFVEHQAQPDQFSSILDGMWWGAITLTTVGYGDIYPITFLGKILGVIIAILGIGLFAMPAGIIASGFVTELQKRKTKKRICPHCGEELEE